MVDGTEWTIGADATVARGHHHAAGAPHAAPQDIPTERLAPLLADPPPAPVNGQVAVPAGGQVEVPTPSG